VGDDYVLSLIFARYPEFNLADPAGEVIGGLPSIAVCRQHPREGPLPRGPKRIVLPSEKGR
jgi:hypothetical protein